MDEVTPEWQFPSEFKSEEEIDKLFLNNSLTPGRMIGYSKSGYVKEYPDNAIIFNANIVTESKGKIWYGDLDVTKSFNDLKNIADKLKENLYILYESDARWENENKPVKELIKKAKYTIETKK